jgi:hypothetical protein
MRVSGGIFLLLRIISIKIIYLNSTSFNYSYLSLKKCNLRENVLPKVFGLNCDHFQGKDLQNMYEFKRLKALIIQIVSNYC